MKLAPQPFLSAEKIQSVVFRVAKEIQKDYDGKPLVVVGVLNGSFVFLADLVRELNLDIQIELIGVSSYVGTESSGQVRVTRDFSKSLSNKHVLFVEDIVDTGLTMDFLIKKTMLQRPASLEVCTLLSKPSERKIEIIPKYIGFEIPPKFVVGYGLDYNGRWRNLPAIYEVIES